MALRVLRYLPLNLAIFLKRQEMAKAVKLFFKTIGVPPKMVADKAREQILGDTKRLCQLSECQIIKLEKGTPSAN